MKKSIRKKYFNGLKIRRPSIKGTQHRVNSNTNLYNSKGKDFYTKTLRQLAVCIVIVLLVIVIKNINTPITNKTEEILETSLSQELNAKSTFDKILRYAKETPKLTDKAISVFVNKEDHKDLSLTMVPPVNGEVVSQFGESMDPLLSQKTFQRGIDVSVRDKQQVKSIAPGEIVEVGQGNSLGNYVKIKHEDNLFSIYGNVNSISVQKGQKVEQGQSVAEIYSTNDNGTKPFHFELWVDGNVVDPMGYIEFNKKAL